MAVGREERGTGRYHKIGMRGRGGEEEASSSLGVFFPRSEGEAPVATAAGKEGATQPKPNSPEGSPDNNLCVCSRRRSSFYVFRGESPHAHL